MWMDTNLDVLLATRVDGTKDTLRGDLGILTAAGKCCAGIFDTLCSHICAWKSASLQGVGRRTRGRSLDFETSSSKAQAFRKPNICRRRRGRETSTHDRLTLAKSVLRSERLQMSRTFGRDSQLARLASTHSFTEAVLLAGNMASYPLDMGGSGSSRMGALA